jgi:hypothetical protein
MTGPVHYNDALQDPMSAPTWGMNRAMGCTSLRESGQVSTAAHGSLGVGDFIDAINRFTFPFDRPYHKDRITNTVTQTSVWPSA